MRIGLRKEWERNQTELNMPYIHEALTYQIAFSEGSNRQQVLHFSELRPLTYGAKTTGPEQGEYENCAV